MVLLLLTLIDQALQGLFKIMPITSLCRISLDIIWDVDISGLAPFTHEEADTRLLLHLEDAVKKGHNKVLIYTVDTDVVVLAVTAAQCLNIDEFWVAFGVGNNFIYIAAQDIPGALGPDQCAALLIFHTFTGCNAVSYFGGRGKRTAWETWNAYGGVTAAFCALAARPSPESIEEHMGLLGHFIDVLYNRISDQKCLNQARKQLITQKGRSLDGLPPTRAALNSTPNELPTKLDTADPR
ncbi:hypothetical protein Hamer_G025546 [Homarus americanus]|uniref:Uncharacterized protein n=1 Tax=Homarus americanus TaxID=6706 RepID=A0A8J5MKY6_HOMAM|nr:hypothetical protein Hamer_G025546 [Homarus americanus]